MGWEGAGKGIGEKEGMSMGAGVSFYTRVVIEIMGDFSSDYP